MKERTWAWVRVAERWCALIGTFEFHTSSVCKAAHEVSGEAPLLMSKANAHMHVNNITYKNCLQALAVPTSPPITKVDRGRAKGTCSQKLPRLRDKVLAAREAII